MAEVVRAHRGPPPKSLDSDKNFKPEHTLFCRKLRFVAIYTLFGYLWANFFSFFFGGGSKTVFRGIYCIYTELHAKNNAFVAKIIKYALDKNFMAIFAFADRLPTSATLVTTTPISLHLGWRACRIPSDME